MFNARRLKVSEHGRPFWLLVALAILLLAWVSAGHARVPDPAMSIGALERDLAALRLQLDGIDGSPVMIDRRAAFDADLGDGSQAFRRRSLLTVARAAGRHLERLIVGYRHADRPNEARRARGLRLDLVELQHRLARLVENGDPVLMKRARRDAGRLLDRLDDSLAGIIARHPSTVAGHPAGATISEAAAADLASGG